MSTELAAQARVLGILCMKKIENASAHTISTQDSAAVPMPTVSVLGFYLVAAAAYNCLAQLPAAFVSRFSLAAPAAYTCLAQLPTACVSGLSLAPRQPAAAAATVVFTSILLVQLPSSSACHSFVYQNRSSPI